ncbi:hypothetical protein K2173_002548 [Erythroxylum novogranatense]|uniref:VQ domain-containing protein n=1 Tax=Erythroxylum novogranatense TaxID=1862640 RepID=A0AAV8TTD0_9ROSI|nr:hypothetical protein K2173_002548 [Erythroxylum novogranatense]
MKAHSSSSIYFSSSSSSLHLTEYPEETAKSFMSSLHSIRKPQVKPWKKPIAPLPPTPPRVYQVDPVNFRDLVQKLTGPQGSQRLRNVAPPPLDIAGTVALSDSVTRAEQLQLVKTSMAKSSPFVALNQDLVLSENVVDYKASGNGIGSSSFELKPSPSSRDWCSFTLLSPGTLSSLEQSTTL